MVCRESGDEAWFAHRAKVAGVSASPFTLMGVWASFVFVARRSNLTRPTLDPTLHPAEERNAPP
jgi:hypothetical protein